MRDDDSLPGILAADVDRGFEALVRAFQDRLYGFALRLGAGRPDAEEIVQDAFVRAHRALKRYPAERRRALALRPWLYRTTLNLARNRARHRRRRVETVELTTDGAWREPEDDASDRPEARLAAAERRRDLAALLAALPERYRAAVVLRHVDGLAYAEVARVLGQPVGTAKANAHRGIRLLRLALEQAAARDGRSGGARPQLAEVR